MWTRVCVTLVFLLYVKVCGNAPLNNRIVGGQSALPGAWPWQVSLYSLAFDQHFCGGSLITKDWVMTAVHCFSSINFREVVVHLGKQSLQGSNPKQISRQVAQLILHPNYNSDTQDNDISLLRLNESVPFTNYTRPVCLAAEGSNFLCGTLSWITGWGNIATGVDLPFPGVLQEVAVPIVDRKKCENLLGASLITKNMICAGFMIGGKDSCQGDSGGPMVNKQGTVWVQSGITSWGEGCASPRSPGVYTRVSQYQKWISSILKPNPPGFIKFNFVG
ncbi:serine protease 27-like isoform X2 [Brachyhypopomus gauderio]|uniref:serine protease 27-like isoform X2 n=1 Tax=Brachyhypopomus gauderio TaxID=698409 RepID=UPI004042CE51